MKNTISLLVSFFLFCPLFAQEAVVPDSEDAKKKEINDIKKGENAIYADVIEYVADDVGGDVSVAQQRSMALLQTHVIEVFAKRMNMDKRDVQEIWDVIDDKCQNIVVKKGDLFRVFSYVMKDAMRMTRSKPKQKDIDKYLTKDPNDTLPREVRAPIPTVLEPMELAEVKADGSVSEKYEYKKEKTTDNPAAANVQAENAVAANAGTNVAAGNPNTGQNLVKVEKSEAEENASQVQSTTIEPAPIQSVESQSVAVQPATVKNTSEQLAIVEPAKTQPEIVSVSEEPVANNVQPVQKPVVEAKKVEEVQKVQNIEVPALVQEMLGQENLNSLFRFLIKEKNKQTLMYGNVAKMKNIAQCYIVIVDKENKSLKTVLGLGATERVNYVTKQSDNLDNYKGGNYQAICVQEY